MADFRRIFLITYDGAEMLDITGPSAVFSAANRLAGARLYDVAVASPRGGLVRHGCGLGLDSLPLPGLGIGPRDTVLVAGANAPYLGDAMGNKRLLQGVTRAAQHAGRFGAVCTGAFILAAAGLLEGRRVATHWAGQRQLETAFPGLTVDKDVLYVADGNLWTSAGVSTGIDMALAMVAADHGGALKSGVARQLVLYAHRPGNQSQFSDLLLAQVKSDARFSGLVDWLKARLARPVRVAEMAARLGLSERSFYRRFTEVFGTTPAALFQQLRLDAAKSYIEAGLPIKQVVAKTGFRSEAAFRTAFRAKYGVSPGFHGRMQA